jgi:hypothetical protein
MTSLSEYRARKAAEKAERLKKAAQRAVDQGLSPNHPAISRIQRDNVVQVDFKGKNASK